MYTVKDCRESTESYGNMRDQMKSETSIFKFKKKKKRVR